MHAKRTRNICPLMWGGGGEKTNTFSARFATELSRGLNMHRNTMCYDLHYVKKKKEKGFVLPDALNAVRVTSN